MATEMDADIPDKLDKPLTFNVDGDSGEPKGWGLALTRWACDLRYRWTATHPRQHPPILCSWAW